MKKRYLLWIVFVTSLFGCNNGDKMTKEKMEIIIREELPIGTSADKIENFFIKEVCHSFFTRKTVSTSQEFQ